MCVEKSKIIKKNEEINADGNLVVTQDRAAAKKRTHTNI